tara:strand:- start:28 stop:330 length:303 start_codon:yes stop_codon:yes gene_type:complete
MNTEKRYFIVHGRTSCPFCVRAVEVLETRNIAYIFSPLEGDVLNEAKQKWDHPTVPIVVERDLYDYGHEQVIGGYDDLCDYLREHENPEEAVCDLDNNTD